MLDVKKISRRSWLAGAGALAGATCIGGGRALAAPTPTKSAVVSIYLEGGMNALLCSADSFMSRGSFGVTSSNVKNLGNGLFVDATTIGTLGDWALGHMAAIGNRHGGTDHVTATRKNFVEGGKTFPVELAAALGGDAAFKAVALGDLPDFGLPSTNNGVSLQLLRSMEDVARALGLGATDPKRPSRAAAGPAIARSREMSERALAANPRSLASVRDAYDTCIGSLAKPPLAIDLASIAQAYGTKSSGTLDTIAQKVAAAELMLRSGTNVATMSDLGWDTHGDQGGQTVRRRMSTDVIPALRTFIGRTRSDPALASINVTILIDADFARSLPSSDHAPALSAMVIGPNVKVGTTGRLSPTATLPAGTPGSLGMWSYVAAVARAPGNPFGANPHALVL